MTKQIITSVSHPGLGLEDPWVVGFIPRTYDETGPKGAEPQKRWVNAIVGPSQSKWHVKVTFRGTLKDDQNWIAGHK